MVCVRLGWNTTFSRLGHQYTVVSKVLFNGPLHRITERSEWSFTSYQPFFFHAVAFYPVVERDVQSPNFPKRIFWSFSAYCPSYLHTIYHGFLTVFTLQNTCVCGQNPSVARLFCSRCAFIILRDIRDKCIYFEWITSVKLWWSDADGGREELSTPLPVHLSWTALESIWACGFTGTTVLLSVIFWPNTLLHFFMFMVPYSLVMYMFDWESD
jgi:hypothetical protein